MKQTTKIQGDSCKETIEDFTRDEYELRLKTDFKKAQLTALVVIFCFTIIFGIVYIIVNQPCR